MLRILALSAALAAPTVDLPELFADDLERIGPRTGVPILLPQTMRDDFDEYFPTGFGREKRWGLQIGAAPNCGGATACFVADFQGSRRGRPFGSRTLALARGRVGHFKPLSCGASCSPPAISWRERGATYSIQAKVPGRRALVKMANSAIRHGAR
jgi:hypothetical protein